MFGEADRVRRPQEGLASGRLQRAQAAGAHLHHLVITLAAGLLHAGHPRPPGTIELVPLPREQVPDDAAGHLHSGGVHGVWSPHDTSMRNHVQ